MLEIRNLCKSYGGIDALADVDLDIAVGEILGLLGPNGAGKSTLISLVAGLAMPDSGTITIDGLDIRSNPMQVRRRLGVAPQELGIYLQLSVRQNLRFFGRLVGLDRGALHDRLERIADALDLTPLLDRRAQDLSGGEKRRLHTAMALLHEARLLLLDEPTAGVDIDTRNKLLAFIRELAAEGTAICYATHYLHEVEALDASVAILDGGRLTSRGTVSEILAAFDDALVEIRFDGALPATLDVDGRVDDDDSLLRITTSDPAATINRVLMCLGSDADRLRGIEIVQPSLESAYLALTGHRFDAQSAGAQS